MSSLATGAIWDTLFITFCTLPIVSTMPSIPPMRSMTCLMSPIEKPLFLAVVSSTTVAIGDSAAWLYGTMAVVVSNGGGGVNDGKKGAGSGLKLRICALFPFAWEDWGRSSAATVKEPSHIGEGCSSHHDLFV